MMNTATEFYRPQVGDGGVINYCYTDKPLRLLAKDIKYFFVYCWALLWVVMPLTPCQSGELDELYPCKSNLFCIATHIILCVLQLFFIVSLPILLLFPMWMGAAYVGGFILLNRLICMLLNGQETSFKSDDKYAASKPEHEHEQWVFLNGVSVGEHWMKNNLNRLALTFGRPVIGIHNRTSGLLFDIIECLIQRNLSFATGDIRTCYKLLKDILYDTAKSKVVFILHSQGGIEGGLVLDWLLQEMPQDLLAKLEVYTFGNAANHFNNPYRRIVSQDLSASDPLAAIRTSVTETRGSAADENAAERPNGLTSRASAALAKESSVTSTSSAANGRALGHVEHYAHSTDFVAIWGVLHFATNRMGSRELPRFLGRLFCRATRLGGHLLNQHYLNGLFPLVRDPKTGALTGASEKNDFMEEVVKVGKEGEAMENAREAFALSYDGDDGFGSGDIQTPVEVHRAPTGILADGREVKVKDLSRLWQYRNGRSPKEKPPLLMTEAGVVRNATM